jgi:hypothetical protein
MGRRSVFLADVPNNNERFMRQATFFAEGMSESLTIVVYQVIFYIL